MNEHRSEEKTATSKILLAVESVALTIACFKIVPPLIRKYGNKIYKVSLKKEEIDFENMGPVIIRENDTNQSHKEE